MLGLAVLEHVQKIGTVVNAGAEQHHVGVGLRGENEITDRARAQIGLVLELRREESVERVLVQLLVQQKLPDRPVLEPVRPLVGRVVQYAESGIEVRRGRVVIQNLEYMPLTHAVLY